MTLIFQSRFLTPKFHFTRTNEASYENVHGVLGLQKVMILFCESQRNLSFSLGNTWSTFVDFIICENVWKYEY